MDSHELHSRGPSEGGSARKRIKISRNGVRSATNTSNTAGSLPRAEDAPIAMMTEKETAKGESTPCHHEKVCAASDLLCIL